MKELIASATFFTRLPLWKIFNLPAESFKNLVPYWSIVGWLTGGVMAITYILASLLFPMAIAAILALLSRIMLTGAIHEDGLADFCDGFGGGGNDSRRVLEIMKDSHIGTYGVIGLAIYYLLFFICLIELPSWLVPAALIGCDAWSKFCAAQIINILPYARKENEAKNKIVYSRMNARLFFISLIGGALPLLFLPKILLPAILFPVLTSATLIIMMKLRINGYTGDCCGATFVISELSFYLGILLILQFCPVI